MKLVAVLFDVTGTLIELTEGVGETYARIAARHGVSVPAEEIQFHFAQAIRRAPPCLFPGLPLPETPAAERGWWRDRVGESFEAGVDPAALPDFEAFFAELFDFYAEAGAWRLRPGIHEALETTRNQGLRMGVISNFDHRLPRVLEALDLSQYMEAVVFPARCGFAKPDHRAFEWILAEMALSPAACAYVGHDPALDLAPARAAGLQTLRVGPGEELPTLSARIEGIATLPT